MERAAWLCGGGGGDEVILIYINVSNTYTCSLNAQSLPLSTIIECDHSNMTTEI